MPCSPAEHRAAASITIDSSRRRFLRLSFGSALGLALAGPGLGQEQRARQRSVILLWLQGGPSQIDSFDPKQNCSEAGPYGAIATRIPGAMFSDRLPLLAQRADRMAILRGLKGIEPEHNRAQAYALTGQRPSASPSAPSIGSLVWHEAGPAGTGAMPAYCSIHSLGPGGGFLGAAYDPFFVAEAARLPENFDLGGIEASRLARRVDWLGQLEAANPALAQLPVSRERQGARARALALLSSRERAAFDLNREPSAARERFGHQRVGQGLLLARRLVEAGARFVQVTFEGWDSHRDNFRVHHRQLGMLDHSLAALLDDLAERGRLSDVVVLVMGEFGRTPRINRQAGRDHHIACYFALLAGAGIQPGVVHGQTHPKGHFVTHDLVSVPDVLATVLTAVRIEPAKTIAGPGGRSIPLVEKGQPIRAILS